MSAYRAGADLVYIIAPERAADTAANFSPLLITEPLKGRKLIPSHVKKVLSFVEEIKPNSVVIGPGLWRENDTIKAIIELIEKVKLPMVIDADAIRAVSDKKAILTKKTCVLTPHADEFRQLSGFKVLNEVGDRVRSVRHEAKKIGNVILLKGHVDVISDGNKIVLNKSGNPKMTVGGMGDTLAGICGAYLARGVDTFISACGAAFVNGLAGTLAVKKYGESAVTTDLIDEIHNAIK